MCLKICIQYQKTVPSRGEAQQPRRTAVKRKKGKKDYAPVMSYRTQSDMNVCEIPV